MDAQPPAVRRRRATRGPTLADRYGSIRRGLPAPADVLDRWRRRSRHRAVRRALRGRALALLTSAVVLHLTVSTVQAADRRQRGFGESVPVVVAVTDLEAGTPLGPKGVRVEQRPVAFVPDGALRSVPEGVRLRADVADGEVLHAGRITAAPTAAAAVLPAGHSAVPFAATAGTAAVSDGDVVDLHVGDAGPGHADFPSAEGGSTRAASRRVASSALVLEVGSDSVIVAVPDEQVDAAVAASLGGDVAMVVRGPSGSGDRDVVDD